ncbi:hypothetical protein RB531_4377 [Salmonella enterica subsp. enterica serovar Typhimurium]
MPDLDGEACSVSVRFSRSLLPDRCGSVQVSRIPDGVAAIQRLGAETAVAEAPASLPVRGVSRRMTTERMPSLPYSTCRKKSPSWTTGHHSIRNPERFTAPFRPAIQHLTTEILRGGGTVSGIWQRSGTHRESLRAPRFLLRLNVAAERWRSIRLVSSGRNDQRYAVRGSGD